ncbi:MAG: ImmA/IrrE family metallo-endopeptidase [Armatimonadota bacterium]
MGTTHNAAVNSECLIRQDNTITGQPNLLAVDVDEFARRLGIEIVPFSTAGIENISVEFAEIGKEACGFLERHGDHSILYLNSDTSPTRMRFTVAHECGHVLDTEHPNANYLCLHDDIESDVVKPIERVANQFAAEILMPYGIFVDVASSLQINMAAIQRIASIFDVSFEAAGIRYADTHPSRVAFMMLEYNQPFMIGDASKNGNRYPTEAVFSNRQRFPYTVMYCACSANFPEHIVRGSLVECCSLIDLVLKRGRMLEADIPIRWYGDDEIRVTVWADCLPWTRYGCFPALIWLP